MNTTQIETLLKGSHMPQNLKKDFAVSLLNRAEEIAEDNASSVEDAFKRNIMFYVSVASYDAKKYGWTYGFAQVCRGLEFDMPYTNKEIQEKYNISPDLYWGYLGDGIKAIAFKGD